jgi:Cep192 domain 4/Abnormal spindle-like microcephaly-assoc'd, ASPM-SPD-2-Hydin/HYDIN/CFA65/VesB-like, Ig-like domain
VGSNSTQSITLTNSGTSSITIFQASASGTGFSSDLNATTLNAGQSTSFIARFAPASTGGASGAITITSNATNPMMLIALSGTGTQGSLGANPSNVNFGNRLLGSSVTVPITLTNSGTSGVAISQATASGAGFSISGLVPMTLNAGQSTSFTATFVPTTAGAVTGSVSISSSAPGSPLTIALSGSSTQAQPQLQLTINPASVAFGNVAVGSSAAQNVTLTNSGSGSLNITGVTPSGTGFSLTGLTTQTISAGASVTFPVKFSPSSAGSATGSISISSNAPGSPATIALSGTGVQGQLTANPANFNFGSVLVGNNGSQTITLINGGTASVAISGGSASGAGYSISGLSATALKPGQSTAFTVQFSPSGVGAASGSISITSNAPNSSLTISLSGSGIQPQLGANPSSASFGNVIIGNSNSQTINLTNGGTAAVSISQANVSGAGFSISGLPALPMTINPGVSATFNAVFTPTATGSVTGSISVVSNTPNSSLAIPLSGTGLSATHLLSASPTSLSFNNVNVGGSNSLSVTLTNTGNSNVTISAVTASGAGFDTSGASGTTLAPTQAATLNVTFAPSVAGAVSGSVAVASNATNSPAIALSGTGVQQVSHSVALTWTASTSSGVVGYNIYRSTVSGGPYVILDSAAVSADTYTDSSVQSGTTYFYVVRSVDNTGAESVNSSQVQATIP